jgi:hypothetical protein
MNENSIEKKRFEKSTKKLEMGPSAPLVKI